jgi:hypothetical protein
MRAIEVEMSRTHAKTVGASRAFCGVICSPVSAHGEM